MYFYPENMLAFPWQKGHIASISSSNLKRMDFLTDLFAYLSERKKWILAPVIMLLLLVVVVFIIGGSSALGTSIYSLF